MVSYCSTCDVCPKEPDVYDELRLPHFGFTFANSADDNLGSFIDFSDNLGFVLLGPVLACVVDFGQRLKIQ